MQIGVATLREKEEWGGGMEEWNRESINSNHYKQPFYRSLFSAVTRFWNHSSQQMQPDTVVQKRNCTSWKAQQVICVHAVHTRIIPMICEGSKTHYTYIIIIIKYPKGSHYLMKYYRRYFTPATEQHKQLICQPIVSNIHVNSRTAKP